MAPASSLSKDSLRGETVAYLTIRHLSLATQKEEITAWSAPNKHVIRTQQDIDDARKPGYNKQWKEDVFGENEQKAISTQGAILSMNSGFIVKLTVSSCSSGSLYMRIVSGKSIGIVEGHPAVLCIFRLGDIRTPGIY